MQSDKKFCLILGLFLFKMTVMQMKESMSSLPLNQIDLNAKYSKAEMCTMILRSLAFIAHSYQEVQQKLLCKPDHWIHVNVEQAVNQDSVLGELTTIEIGRAIQVIISLVNNKLITFYIKADPPVQVVRVRYNR